MKQILFASFCFLMACTNPDVVRQAALQTRIDSLEYRLAQAYKPGFGEFMSSVQAHHAKLWFAGQAQNWKLADFEIHEMIEAMDNIRTYQTARKESQKISMIYPALDSVNQAIQAENNTRFKIAYLELTQTCNNCHQATDFGFNRVKVPENQPYPNQDFNVR